jgi:hypothetical protein
LVIIIFLQIIDCLSYDQQFRFEGPDDTNHFFEEFTHLVVFASTDRMNSSESPNGSLESEDENGEYYIKKANVFFI